MTFKRKIIIVFSLVTILPLVLCMIAFLLVGNYLVHMTQPDQPLQYYNRLSENIQSLGHTTQNAYDSINNILKTDPQEIEDKGFLSSLEEEIEEKGAHIIVRKGSQIYYNGDPALSENVLAGLPEYGDMSGADAGYFLNGTSIYARQIDFTFTDGSKGSIFLLTRYVTQVNRSFLLGMFFSVIGILLLTALLLTRWLKKSVFQPIDELNVAMNKIRDGDFSYRLATPKENSELAALYGNYEDMRMRLKESADEKLEQEKQNRELISNISHDLKTPITSIKGYAAGLIDGVANTPEKQDKYIRTIYNKANDMNNLINELTLYSRIDSDRIPYNFRKINVSDYFGDCVEEIGMDMESRGIVLNYSNAVSPDTQIIADPEQMKRVINNIISNSVKYMDKPQGKIEIRILDEQDSIRIEVEDNGKGIAAKDLPNIFDRFYRTDSSRNSAQGGSGIGLSIVKKIVEDHGGYIWATSRDGEGTCMHFVMRKYREKENPSVDVV